MLRPGFLIHTALPLSVYAYLSFLTAKRSTFPPTSLLISCYFSGYFTFIPSHIHSLFTLPLFIYSLIRISIFFLIFIQNVKANTVYLHTCDYDENDLNKNESARYYIQFSYCDSLQNRESCRDELYKTSRQRWCHELDVCLHPSSGDTFLSICQLHQLNRGNNHLEHHLWNDSNFEGPQVAFYTYFDELEA